MGLVRGMVTTIDKRAALAILAIAISVGYSLVAGAAVSGLKDAQETLASDLHDTDHLVAHTDLSPIDTAQLPPGLPDPTLALATHTLPDPGVTLFAVLDGDSDGQVPNASVAIPGPNAPVQASANLTLPGHTLAQLDTGTIPGADPAWVQVHPQVLTNLTGTATLHPSLLVYDDLTPTQQASLADQGLVTHQSPSAAPFYEAGADQLIDTVGVTVLSSAIVVGLLATGFIHMELRARRQSLATLQMFSGPGLVRRLIFARGIVLLVAGHALGLGLTWALLEGLGRAGVQQLALPFSYTQVALGATMTGGILGLVPPVARASSRLTASELGDEAPPDWLPGILRPITTSWRVLLPLCVSAIVLAASLGVIYGMIDLPGQLFGAEGDQVIAETTGNPLRGQVDAFTGLHLAQTDAYEAASPEIFAPTLVSGQPVMARGVSWSHLTTMTAVTLTSGHAPDEPGQAVAGTRLADRLDLTTGDRLVLPGSYARSLVPVTIVGTASAPGLIGDELLVPLETARSIADQAPGTATLVRYRQAPADDVTQQGQAPGLPSGIEVTRLTLVPSDPVPFQQAAVHARLVNFAAADQTRHLTLRVNGQPTADTWAEVPAKATGTAVLPFRVPKTGVLSLEVNPELSAQTGDPAYLIQVPPASTVARNLTITVTDTDDQPVQAVDVTIADQEATTGQDGKVTLKPSVIGNHTILAEGPEGRGATTILIVGPGDLHRPNPVIQTITGPTEGRAGTWHGVAQATNLGGETFDGPLPVPVNGTIVNTTDTRLLPGQSARVEVSIRLPAGSHTLGPPGASMTVTLDPRGQGSTGEAATDEDTQAKTLEELLELRRQRVRQAQETGQDATTAFIGDTFENLQGALTIVTLATVLHAGLITLVAVFRETEEHAPNTASLTALGANRREVRAVAIREHLIIGTVAAAIGTILGLALAFIGAQAGLLAGFGHTLTPRTTPTFGLRLAAGAIATTLAAAILAIEQLTGQDAARTIRRGPERTRRPSLDRLLEGRA